jgi:hypothetical protein
MKLSEKMRSLLSTWMAGYAQPLVIECADQAEKLEAVAEAASSNGIFDGNMSALRKLRQTLAALEEQDE